MTGQRRFLYGFVCCMLAEVSFGMNGFGSTMLGRLGVETHSILFYRFAFASVLIAILAAVRGESARIAPRDALTGLLCGLCFAGSALTLYMSFTLMDTGLACTLLFVYPFMTIAIMAVLFHERISLPVVLSAVVAFTGTAVVSVQGGGAVSLAGFLYVMLSALSYSGYMIIFERRKPKLGAFQMSLFTTVVSALAIAAHGWATGHPVQAIHSAEVFGYGLFLALVPTVISVYFTVEALKHLGPTLTGVFGSLEPLTAVVVGVLFLGEAFTTRLVVGSTLIMASVTYLAILSNRQRSTK